jgi:GntR family transcriptional repressor for pyruvate dehydrogenase complex
VLLDLVNARMLLELQCVRDAVHHATPEHLAEMHRLLTEAGEHLHDANVQHSSNMGFHRQIAAASGNAVLAQLIDVLVELFSEEQRLIGSTHVM